MEWKYIKPLLDEKYIYNLECMYNLYIPKVLKDIIKKYNGGRPEKNIFDTEESKAREFKCLLSYNKNDKDNIYICEDLLKMNYIPFAITPSGDIICIENKSKYVKLFLHETNSFEVICINIESFINKLYI